MGCLCLHSKLKLIFPLPARPWGKVQGQMGVMSGKVLADVS